VKKPFGNTWRIKMSELSFDFYGKDSIRYQNTIEVPSYVAKAIKSFCKNKKDDDQIFDLIDASDINKFLSECMPECTAKLFRTAIASKLLVDAFKEQKVTKGMSIREKLHAFDMANLAVAKKLNHKKALPKNFDAQLEKLDTQIQTAIDKAEETTSKVEFNLKKIRSEIARANKNFEGDVLKTALKNLKEKEAKEKAKLAKAEEKVTALKEKRDFKGQTGDIAISTSRTNYCTPEIAYSICNDLDIPIDKIYTKTLREKFAWAEGTPKNYWRKYPEV
jgi:DNA topoisomerase-1